jgi:hypothetical protein
MTDKTPEEIFHEMTGGYQRPTNAIFQAMREYGDQQWNAALEAAADKVKFKYVIGKKYRIKTIDKQSILSLKR